MTACIAARYPRWRVRGFATLLATVLGISGLNAQAPLRAGSAVGWGATALTEARFGESLWWNPALIALPDVSNTTFSFLSGSLEGGSNAVSRTAFPSVLGTLVSGGSPAEVMGPVAGGLVPADRFRLQGEGSMQWLGATVRGTGLSVLSTSSTDFRFGSRVVDILADSVQGPAGGADRDQSLANPSSFYAATTAAVARSGYLTHLPVLGHVWGGVSGKYSLVHSYARGTTVYGTASGLAAGLPEWVVVDAPTAHGFVEHLNEVRGTSVWGADAGLVFNPIEPLIVSVNAVNFYQSASLGSNPLGVRQIWSLGQSNEGGAVRTASLPVDIETLSAEDREVYEGLARDAQFLRVLRVGAAWDLERFRVAAAGSWAWEPGAALNRDQEARYGASLAYRSPGAPRVSYARLYDDSHRLSLGGERARCSGSSFWSLDLREGETWGIGLGFGFTVGSRSGCEVQ